MKISFHTAQTTD